MTRALRGRRRSQDGRTEGRTEGRTDRRTPPLPPPTPRSPSQAAGTDRPRRRLAPQPAASRPAAAHAHAQAPVPAGGAGQGQRVRPPRRGHVAGLKMAAAAATFRRLRALGRLPPSGPGAAAAAPARPYGVRASATGELVTHTGQVYDEKDYRRVRFVGRQKEVNKNFAIDLIAEQPVSQVESRVISCDGGGGALGHPKVYINLDKDTKTGTCGYCGLQFKQKHH
ncbi:NADH dehydrogenase [ubiquinone] iron-sulfur protein 6, mitochondrial [Apus apus]|nr:NADH dehydrogenase [ubiquinone] iron-sulfur protein 6, mitochondrial [Apus apus]